MRLDLVSNLMLIVDVLRVDIDINLKPFVFMWIGPMVIRPMRTRALYRICACPI